MKFVTVQDVTESLASLLSKASDGETVTITENGTPVAALGPPDGKRGTMQRQRGFVSHLMRFPGIEVDRNAQPARDIDL